MKKSITKLILIFLPFTFLASRVHGMEKDTHQEPQKELSTMLRHQRSLSEQTNGINRETFFKFQNKFTVPPKRSFAVKEYPSLPEDFNPGNQLTVKPIDENGNYTQKGCGFICSGSKNLRYQFFDSNNSLVKIIETDFIDSNAELGALFGELAAVKRLENEIDLYFEKKRILNLSARNDPGDSFEKKLLLFNNTGDALALVDKDDTAIVWDLRAVAHPLTANQLQFVDTISATIKEKDALQAQPKSTLWTRAPIKLKLFNNSSNQLLNDSRLETFDDETQELIKACLID